MKYTLLLTLHLLFIAPIFSNEVYTNETLLQTVNNNPNNSHAHYNLGTAYLKQKQIGKAIIHLEKAHLLKPRDLDIKHNLLIARESVIDNLNTEDSIFALFNKSFKILTADEWIILCLIIIILSTWRLRRCINPILDHKVLITLNSILILITISQYTKSLDNYVVIQENQAPLRESPSQTIDYTLLLDEGIKAKIIKNHKKWVKISFSNGFSGWIEKKYTQKI